MPVQGFCTTPMGWIGRLFVDNSLIPVWFKLNKLEELMEMVGNDLDDETSVKSNESEDEL